jgi:hypothetical protein
MAAVIPFFVACNFFSPFDQPSGDAQLTSAAEACLNSGDFKCAAHDYEQLSSSSSDVAASGIAFGLLDQNGADFGSFVTAFGDGANNSAGTFVTLLANHLSTLSPGPTLRLGMFQAYQQVELMNPGPLRGVVRFTTAIALIAEILSEDARSPGNLRGADLAADPAGCAQVASSACFGSVSCTGPIGSKLVSGPNIASLDSATVAQLSSAAPTFHAINAAMAELSSAVTEMNSGASFTAFVQQITSVINSSTLPVDNSYDIDSPCFRWGLITNNVGGS